MPYTDPEKQKAAQARYYQDNKTVYRKRQRDRRNLARQFIIEYKDGKECTDCGISYPYHILQFDHLRDKRASLAQLSRDANLDALKEEIAKCELVCANCHAHRTQMRKLSVL